jgi:hypothetical protein
MNKSYDIKWQRDDDKITISKTFFEHLLNCLANQKYVGELPTCGDALAEGPEKYKNVQEEIQKVIDVAWREGMFILSIGNKGEILIEKMLKSFSMKKIQEEYEKDFEDFPSDLYIGYKWTHLFGQEIRMWITLACTTDANIDCENEIFEFGQVSLDDFNEICKRRGFTPRIISALRNILKEIGIGGNL